MTLLGHQIIVLEDGHRVGVTRTANRSGTPLVFCHGLSTHGRLYTRLLSLLADSGYYVVAVDMAGHGDTDALPFGHSFDAMVDILARTLHRLCVHKAIMVGHSLGGRLVAEFSAAHPERVYRTILVNAAVGDHFDALDVKPDKVAVLPILVGGAVLDMFGDIPWRKPRKAWRYLRDLKKGQPTNVAGVRNAVWAARGPRTVDTLQRMSDNLTPTTVIHTAWDLIVPVACGVQAAKLTGGELIVLPGFHNWLVVHPARAANAILEAIQ